MNKKDGWASPETQEQRAARLPGLLERRAEGCSKENSLCRHLLYLLVERYGNDHLEYPHPSRSLPGPINSVGVKMVIDGTSVSGKGVQQKGAVYWVGVSPTELHGVSGFIPILHVRT